MEINLSQIFQKMEEEMGASKLLGIEKAIVENNRLSLELVIEAKHLNVNRITHGGILYALCDQAVGAYVEYVIGRKGTGMDGSIHYYRPSSVGERLVATVFERKRGKRVGVFCVEVKNAEDKLVCDSTFSVMFMDTTKDNADR